MIPLKARRLCHRFLTPMPAKQENKNNESPAFVAGEPQPLRFF
jgi:hypothetical protein